jgi:hypothetical protein
MKNGKTYSSVPFANQLQTWMNMGRKQICFVVGGAFGFHTSVYERADAKLSLSSMTFFASIGSSRFFRATLSSIYYSQKRTLSSSIKKGMQWHPFF